jgi:tetratricopeptide (TPR) repeat protein
VIGLAAGGYFLDLRKREAQEQFRITRDAARTFLVSVNEEELLHEPGMQPLREKLLREALGYYARFLESRPGDPEVLQEQAEANRQLGELYAERGKAVPARPLLDKAVRAFEGLRGRNPTDRELRRGLAQAYLARAGLNERGAEGESELADAGRGVELLAALVAESPNDPA